MREESGFPPCIHLGPFHRRTDRLGPLPGPARLLPRSARRAAMQTCAKLTPAPAAPAAVCLPGRKIQVRATHQRGRRRAGGAAIALCICASKEERGRGG